MLNHQFLQSTSTASILFRASDSKTSFLQLLVPYSHAPVAAAPPVMNFTGGGGVGRAPRLNAKGVDIETTPLSKLQGSDNPLEPFVPVHIPRVPVSDNDDDYGRACKLQHLMAVMAPTSIPDDDGVDYYVKHACCSALLVFQHPTLNLIAHVISVNLQTSDATYMLKHVNWRQALPN